MVQHRIVLQQKQRALQDSPLLMLTLDTIYFVSQTLMVFIPDSASERVLKDTGPTCVTVVVVVGFLSTMVQRFVELSWTT